MITALIVMGSIIAGIFAPRLYRRYKSACAVRAELAEEARRDACDAMRKLLARMDEIKLEMTLTEVRYREGKITFEECIRAMSKLLSEARGL